MSTSNNSVRNVRGTKPHPQRLPVQWLRSGWQFAGNISVIVVVSLIAYEIIQFQSPRKVTSTKRRSTTSSIKHSWKDDRPRIQDSVDSPNLRNVNAAAALHRISFDQTSPWYVVPESHEQFLRQQPPQPGPSTSFAPHRAVQPVRPVSNWSYGRPFDEVPDRQQRSTASQNEIMRAQYQEFAAPSIPQQGAYQPQLSEQYRGAGAYGQMPANSWTMPSHPSYATPEPVETGAHANFPSPPVTPLQTSTDERRLSFQFQAAPWETVLKYFATQSGMSLQLTQVPPGTFSYFDHSRFTPTEAIDILNDSLLPQGFVLIRSQHHLVVASTKSELPDQMIPFVTAEDLPKLGRHQLASLAIPVYGAQAQQASQEVEKLLSPVGAVKPLTSSRRLLVRDTGSSLRRLWSLLAELPDDAINQTFVVVRLKNTPAEDVARAINEFLSSRQGASVSTQPVNGNGGGQAPPRSSGFGGSQAQVVVAEKTTNCLLLRGSPRDISEIQSVICELDRSPSQVVIQALLVEVELGDTDEFGTEFGVQDSVLFNRSVIDKVLTVTETSTLAGGNQTTTQKIISQTANPGFNFNNQPLGNNIAASPGTLGSQGLSSLGVGRVNGDLGFGGLVLSASNESISILLRALQAHYKTDILSRPQIRTLDNHEALIQIGRQVPVVDGVAITAVGSANPVVRQDKAGLILKVTPRISPDGMVLIDVNAEKSAYQLAPGTGVPIFTDATNGNVIEAPVKDITTAQTSVSMRTGQTIVLGGMITNDMIDVERKIPLLGDIPYLGALFKYRLDRSTRKELLIFLTPHVIENEQQSEEMKRVEASRVSTSWEHAQSIHGPLFNPPTAEFRQPPIGTSEQFVPAPASPVNGTPADAAGNQNGNDQYQNTQPVPAPMYGPPQTIPSPAVPAPNTGPGLVPPPPAPGITQSDSKPKRNWMPFANRRAVNDRRPIGAPGPSAGEMDSQMVPASGTRPW